MKTITIRGDGADLYITLNELITIRNSINQVLSEIGLAGLHSRTGFYLEEMKTILNSVEQTIKELEQRI